MVRALLVLAVCTDSQSAGHKQQLEFASVSKYKARASPAIVVSGIRIRASAVDIIRFMSLILACRVQASETPAEAQTSCKRRVPGG